jgi:hypothetical protein
MTEKQLKIRLNYQVALNSVAGASAESSKLVLPVRLVDEDGSVVKEAAANTSSTTVVSVPSDKLLFARLTWPSGNVVTERVPIGTTEVSFDGGEIGRADWASWAVPRLLSLTPSPQVTRTRGSARIERHKSTWLQLWRFANSRWVRTEMDATQQYRSDDAIQLDLQLDRRPYALHLGGGDVPWQIVTLPGGGPCRVLVTPNTTAATASTEPLRVLVTTSRTQAETLLEFLLRDNLRAADAIYPSDVAQDLLQSKERDPVSACAGAYFLLRVGQWQDIPNDWYRNLSNRFPWIPDGALIRCIVMLRQGIGTKGQLKEARELFFESLARGNPIFAEGMILLGEAAALLRRQKSASDDVESFALADALVASRAKAGAAFSYYGRSPSLPDIQKYFGPPGSPRLAPMSERDQTTRTSVPAKGGIESAKGRAAPAKLAAASGAPEKPRRTRDASLAPKSSSVPRMRSVPVASSGQKGVLFIRDVGTTGSPRGAPKK